MLYNITFYWQCKPYIYKTTYIRVTYKVIMLHIKHVKKCTDLLTVISWQYLPSIISSNNFGFGNQLSSYGQNPHLSNALLCLVKNS